MLAAAREIHGASPFVTRLQQWPRGYPGDFETIEWLWRGDNRAPGRRARARHRDLRAQRGDRAAAPQQGDAGRLHPQAWPARPCRVLSIGSAAAPMPTVVDQVPRSASFVLCDSDPDALSYSRAKLEPIADRCHSSTAFPRVLRRVTRPWSIRPDGRRPLRLPLASLRRAERCRTPRKLLAPADASSTNIAEAIRFACRSRDMAEWRPIERSKRSRQQMSRGGNSSRPDHGSRRDITRDRGDAQEERGLSRALNGDEALGNEEVRQLLTSRFSSELLNSCTKSLVR